VKDFAPCMTDEDRRNGFFENSRKDTNPKGLVKLFY
jgi:hypothetical protein